MCKTGKTLYLLLLHPYNLHPPVLCLWWICSPYNIHLTLSTYCQDHLSLQIIADSTLKIQKSENNIQIWNIQIWKSLKRYSPDARSKEVANPNTRFLLLLQMGSISAIVNDSLMGWITLGEMCISLVTFLGYCGNSSSSYASLSLDAIP